MKFQEDNLKITFELPDFRQICDDGRILEIAVQVKHNGVWRVHKSDPDKIFPSDFHADRVDAAEKLDIYTGKVYSPLTHNVLYDLPKKAMRYIYQLLAQSKEENIINFLSRRDRFTYLD
jgi:hypothetical protein